MTSRWNSSDAIEHAGRRAPVSSRPVPAWMLSLGMHLGLFLLLGWTLRFAPQGAALEPDRAVGIVLVHQAGGERSYEATSEEASSATAASQVAWSEALPKPTELPVDLPGAADVDQLLAGSPAMEAAGQGTGTPGMRGTGGGPTGSTRLSVFGLTGEGAKFVFVFDRSGSMAGFGGRPLAAAKGELIRSLRMLDEIHQFQIVFYNERPTIFSPDPGPPRLLWGDQRGKELAERFVRGIAAAGSTRHLEALKLGLGMEPDVLFFLTDADEPRLTDAQLRQVRRWNRRTVIHAIEFGLGPPSLNENFLVRLARQNGGQHAYVDISQLP